MEILLVGVTQTIIQITAEVYSEELLIRAIISSQVVIHYLAVELTILTITQILEDFSVIIIPATILTTIILVDYLVVVLIIIPITIVLVDYLVVVLIIIPIIIQVEVFSVEEM